MLAKAEEIDIEFVREHGFVDHIADHLGMRQRRAIGGGCHIAKCIESKFKLVFKLMFKFGRHTD